MSDRPTNSDLYRGGDPSKKSVGQLLKEISEDFSTLFRKEIDLAKAELGSSISAKVQGIVTIAIAGAFAFFALIFLLLAVRDGFDTFLWTWVADLATALILILVGVGAVLFARKKLATPIKADLTKQTVKEDIEWAKTLKKR